MVDKLDLRIPRHAPFTPSFGRVYRELRALEKGPFHSGKYYEYAGDLREYGFSVRLNLFCQMDKAGNHKFELIDVGEMSRSQIIHEIVQVFDIDPKSLAVMRVDFATDLEGIPLQWFRESVRVQHKRFRAAITGERFYSEMGSGDIQTIYFGKRPNPVRIYDKQAENWVQYRNMIRKLGRGIDSPSFESIYGHAGDAPLTRVERQIGGRIPAQVGTLRQVIDSDFEFRPFASLKIIDHAQTPDLDSNLSFETRCTGLYLRSVAENEGMQVANSFISRFSNGNASRVREKYRNFFPSASPTNGITSEELQARFEQSMARQLSG